MSSEEFEQCFKVMDENHDGVISFKEFVNWWKLGRQNSSLMRRFVQLEMMTSKMLNNEKLFELKEEVEHLKCEKGLSRSYINIRSEEEIANPESQLFFHMIKGIERLEHVRTHLYKFQPHSLTEHARWIDITFFLDESVDKEEAFNKLKSIKQNLFLILESSHNDLIDTINRLFLFEYYRFYDENAVVIRMRNKADSQKHLDHSLWSLIELLSSIQVTQELMFDFRLLHNIKDFINSKITLNDLLKVFSIEFKSSMSRVIIKTLIRELSPEIKNLISYFLSPSDISVNCKLDLNNLLNMEYGNELLKPYTESFDQLIQIITSYEETVKKIRSIQFCANAYEIFTRINIKINNLLE